MDFVEYGNVAVAELRKVNDTMADLLPQVPVAQQAAILDAFNAAIPAAMHLRDIALGLRDTLQSGVQSSAGANFPAILLQFSIV